MKRIMNLLGLVLLLALPYFANAQQQPNLHQPVPMDNAVKKGVLPNGMTYYICHNEEPKDRASFYIIQNVGALLENDNQNGLAHFLEHMSFNGTKHYPGKGIISTMEKHGVKFGRDVNAYTAFNETVYNLSNVPVKHEGLMDKCLLVLNDWSNYLLLTEEEIDAERGVISEEWRTRRNASFRLRNQFFPVLLKGSKWAVRDVIGDLNIIQNFKPKTIRDFYHDWYRTDLQAIAIIGDFDVAEMEAKVKKMFSKIPAVKNPRKRPDFKIPNHKETYYCLATDKEAATSDVNMFILKEDSKVKDLATLKDEFTETCYNLMMRSRMKEIMQKGDNECLSMNASNSEFLRGYNAYMISTTAKPNKEVEAFKAVYTECVRAERHGFLQSELDRAKADLKAYLEEDYNTRNERSNDRIANAIKKDYLNNETITNPVFDYKYGLFCLQFTTLKDVNTYAKNVMPEENRTIVITGPSTGVKHATEAEMKQAIADVEASTINAYVDNAANKQLIDASKIKAGKVVSTKELKNFGAKEWTLSNGAKVIFRKADYEKEQITLNAWSKGGTSLIENKDLVSAENTDAFIKKFGLGEFDASTLSKVLAGKNVSVSPYISGITEGFSGFSVPKDAETMMQMLNLYFENPRFDKKVFEVTKGRLATQIEALKNNPQKILSDSLKTIFSNYNKRSHLKNKEYINALNFDKIQKIYKERFNNIGDFTFLIVGNIDEATAKTLAEKYIGSIKGENRSEKWINRSVPTPKGKTTKVLTIPMQTEKGTVIAKYSNTKLKYNAYNLLTLKVIKNILDLRYTEEIREKEGGTYGVGVFTGAKMNPNREFNVFLQFDCDHNKADHLKGLCYKIIDRLIKEGPSQKDFDKAIKALKSDRKRQKPHNEYVRKNIKTYYMTGIDMSADKNYEKIINKLNVKRIRKAFKKFFKKANLIDVTVLPKK